MTYLAWYDAHAAKHRAVVEKLLKQEFSTDEIIAYFAFDNMVDAEPEFCPLYATRTPCHEMEKLNCYLCACPNFRFNDAGLKRQGPYLIQSSCAIHNGTTTGHDGIVHQDCSRCTVPHHESYVREHFDTDWKTIMAACPADSEIDDES
jgi:hypothetical protein